LAASHGSKSDAAAAIHAHCGVSLLRAYRIAHGYTLLETVELLKGILREKGTPSEGLAHQRVSRWENGLDTPSQHYLDALCLLYRTRPDRLGFGCDYSEKEDMNRRDFLRSTAAGALAVGQSDFVLDRETAAVGSLEERAERYGHVLFASDPAVFIPERMVDVATAQKLLLRSQPGDAQTRLHRIIAKNAGYAAIRLVDVAEFEETFNWFQIARLAARRAGDVTIEAWLAGCAACAHSWYGYALKRGLNAAQYAQRLGGERPSSVAMFGCLAEAGVRARLGDEQGTLDAVRRADQMLAELPATEKVEDGIRVSEYSVRWVQSNALAMINHRRRSEVLRNRAYEFPLAVQDNIGRVLLELDEASALLRLGELDHGSQVIMRIWEELPAHRQVAIIKRRTRQVVDEIEPAYSGTPEVRMLREFVNNGV
jgi:transcriptional regulator with XRE-family HTH domain